MHNNKKWNKKQKPLMRIVLPVQEEYPILEKKNCCICKKVFYGLGNNPFPIKKRGVCCDDCNLNKVIPKRLGLLE